MYFLRANGYLNISVSKCYQYMIHYLTIFVVAILSFNYLCVCQDTGQQSYGLPDGQIFSPPAGHGRIQYAPRQFCASQFCSSEGNPKTQNLKDLAIFFDEISTLCGTANKKNCQNQWFIDEQRAEFGLDSKLVGFLHLARALEQEGFLLGEATRNCRRDGGPCVLPQHSKKILQTSSPAHPEISMSWHFWLYHF